MQNFAQIIDALSLSSASQLDSTGAAGGITYIPKAQLKATTELGFDRLAGMFDLEQKVKDADVIITGEGRLDESTFENKAPHQLISLAKKHGKKVIFVCGSSNNTSKSGQAIDWKSRGIDLVVQLLSQEAADDPRKLASSIKSTLTSIVDAVTKEHLKQLT